MRLLHDCSKVDLPPNLFHSFECSEANPDLEQISKERSALIRKVEVTAERLCQKCKKPAFDNLMIRMRCAVSFSAGCAATKFLRMSPLAIHCDNDKPQAALR